MIDDTGEYLIVFHETKGDPIAYDKTLRHFQKEGFERIHKTVYAKRCWSHAQLAKAKQKLQKISKKTNKFKFLKVYIDQFEIMQKEII